VARFGHPGTTFSAVPRGRGPGLALVVLSVVEQRLDTVRAALDGTERRRWPALAGVHRATLHGWVARYLTGQLAGLADRSHRLGCSPPAFASPTSDRQLRHHLTAFSQTDRDAGVPRTGAIVPTPARRCGYCLQCVDVAYLDEHGRTWRSVVVMRGQVELGHTTALNASSDAGTPWFQRGPSPVWPSISSLAMSR
jgi:leucine-zipper of insertion element IS481